QTLLPPGRDPHTYTPLPGQLREAARASCFFYLGLPLEKNFLEPLRQSEHLRIVPLRRGLSLRTMEHEHQHSQDPREQEKTPEHNHEHGGNEEFEDLQGYDPHVWLNPLNMAAMADTMAQTLRQEDPEHAEEYAANATALVDQLEVLHGYLRSILDPVRGRTLLVYHPAYGYFCDAYGLRQMAVEKEGKPPRGKELASLIQIAQKEKIRSIFIQPQFDQRAARTVASAIGARVLSFDPFPEDYIAYFQTMGALLRTELEPPESTKE
ncbi:MAG TPA: zinc ABC transporter substrate-binding protein, partial [Synergistaceae bacterium]|nr:zinc ABC transporter substrate-binding protein [Synergistaceae bacterium]